MTRCIGRVYYIAVLSLPTLSSAATPCMCRPCTQSTNGDWLTQNRGLGQGDVAGENKLGKTARTSDDVNGDK